jgi:hypothetical protein
MRSRFVLPAALGCQCDSVGTRHPSWTLVRGRVASSDMTLARTKSRVHWHFRATRNVTRYNRPLAGLHICLARHHGSRGTMIHHADSEHLARAVYRDLLPPHPQHVQPYHHLTAASPHIVTRAGISIST